jgi:hypothetical protein
MFFEQILYNKVATLDALALIPLLLPWTLPSPAGGSLLILPTLGISACLLKDLLKMGEVIAILGLNRGLK